MYRVARALPCFGVDEDGRLCIAPEWQDRVNNVCDDVERRSIVNKPHRSAPPPWTGWWSNYSDRPRQPFVRDWHVGASAAHEATFAAARPPAGAVDQNRLWEETGEEPSGPFAVLADARLWLPFDHAAGVNAIKSVPLRINRDLLPLVDEFAVRLKKHEGKKRKYDQQTVTTDLRHAGGWGSGANYIDYNCDHRGRLNPIQPLNYAREDHGRALIEFARGAPLTADGVGGREAMAWLEIHCANSWGRDQIDKRPWDERQRWAKKNIDLIERVAADPQGSFDRWCHADKPFAFVAACMELSRALKHGTGFETHCPIGFDGTANGAQHLVLLSFDRRSHNLATERDWEAARLVNLIDNKEPHDLYLAVTRRIMELLWAGDRRLCTKGKSERDAGCFEFWRGRLSELEEEQLRKLFKSPLMTFLYSARPRSMQEKLVEVYADLFEKNEPRDDAAAFLTKAVRLACADTLPGPMRIMKYIRALALHCFKQKKFMEWTSPSGFACSNRYEEPNIVKIDLLYGGVRSRYTVADGTLPEMMKGRILDAAPPNFVHSLDAAHLVRTVLAANRDGIRDFITVHDCYSSLAPFARRFGQLIRREMAILYAWGDPLADLRNANVDDPNTLPLPQRPKIDPLVAQDTEYSFM
jgi:DNA-directed RNA polymerase